MNIVEIAVADPDLDILELALGTAGLVETIQNANDITVFAPTDAAFTQLAVDLGFTGDTTDETAVFNAIAGVLSGLAPDGDPVPLLTDILTYHVSGSVLDAAAVTAATTIPTLNTNADITPDVPVLVDLEPDLINPSLIATDIAADNGIVHLIDRVLLPLDVPGNDAPTITGLVAASGDGPDADPTDFDLLLAAVQTAGLADTLDTAGLDVTVFAPTDAAFVALAQDLGFTGSDEAGALNAIVATLTALGSGDPIPLLTAILTYHVSPGAKQLSQVAGLSEVATLQGGTIGIDGTTLVDNEPDLTDPGLVATDIQASNGIVHAIDRVLLPVDIPTSNGANDVRVVLADAAGGKAAGALDNDLLIDGAGLDDFAGAAGGDVFVLSNDGVRDILRDVELGVDLIDVSAFAASIEDLEIQNLVRRDGTTAWVQITDREGDAEVILRFGDDTALDAAALTADSFVFADGEVAFETTDKLDTEGRDDFRADTAAELFVLIDDDTRDVIRAFDLGFDQIDARAIAGSFEELTITNLPNGAGVTNWVQVSDGAGEELILRFADDTPLDAAALTEDNFVFA